jgi:5-bromo-4-chloroindolyl phosphate hydrolysis protein
MNRKRRGRTSPIYTFVLVWVLLNLFGVPVYHLAGLLATLGISVAAGLAAASILRGKAGKTQEEAVPGAAKAEAAPAQEEKKEEPSPYSPEVQQIITDGRIAMKEMGRLYKSIPDPEVRKKINELMSVSDKIVRDAIDDPSDVPQIRKFLDFYLPTTIKLLNAYDRMSAQDISGENISGSMQRIEDMLDTTIQAYNKQLDALFANQAADIQMDIETMNAMLAREGLGGKSYLDLREFMKQYEKEQKKKNTGSGNEQLTEQKGSTSNG